jgi:hypothetical protein
VRSESRKQTTKFKNSKPINKENKVNFSGQSKKTQIACFKHVLDTAGNIFF